MRRFAVLAALAVICASSAEGAEPNGKIKVGVLSDMGGAMSDYAGKRSVDAAKLAIEDYKRAGGTLDVELISADSQNKPDAALTIARRWFDEDGVDVIVDVPNSAVVLALTHIVEEKNKVLLSTSASSERITGSDCTPNTINWTYSTWALAHGTGQAVVKQGGTSWFFVAVDIEYGRSISEQMRKVIEAAGGKVLGIVRHPLGTTDFSSYIVQAQASGAKVVALANGGNDTINAIKEANAFHLVEAGQILAATVLYVSDIHALGLDVTKGLQFTTAFYWDLDDKTRAFASAFEQVSPNNGKPTQVHAAVYSALSAYLQSAGTLGTGKDGKAVVAGIRARGQFDDSLFGRMRVRADGTAEHAMYLARIEKPSESKGAYDYYKILETIPADQAFQPEGETGCKLSAR